MLGRWNSLGYPSLAAFRAAQDTEAGQLLTMAAYIRSEDLAPHLARLEWRQFAAGYNGTGKIDDYAGRLAEAYARAA